MVAAGTAGTITSHDDAPATFAAGNNVTELPTVTVVVQGVNEEKLALKHPPDTLKSDRNVRTMRLPVETKV